VNNLRIIQFVEADLNMVLNTIWGTRLRQNTLQH
jgi:hypothetical protein